MKMPFPLLGILVTLLVGLLCEADVLKFESQRYYGHVDDRVEPEVSMDANELITSKGFPVENYNVTTQDGYILTLLRIPHGRKGSNPNTPRSVVLLQHGLQGSCTNFLTNLVNQSLAYILADAGADVWIGNSRGTLYSMSHISLNSTQDEFWRFTYDEMAKYDLPATVDFIVNKTRVSQIYYVGHSQGTIIGFAGFSTNKKLASKIKHFIALAPVARVGQIKSPLALLAPYAKTVARFLEFFGHGEFNVESKATRIMKGERCKSWGALICENLLFLSCGFDPAQTNLTRMPVYIAHNPGGTSVENILHWAQQVNSKHFQMFDFGSKEKNRKHYGQLTPPLYQPKDMHVPVSIFRGGQDWLVDRTDADWLISQLPNVVMDKYIDYYAHLDFIWAMNSPFLVYNDILSIVFNA